MKSSLMIAAKSNFWTKDWTRVCSMESRSVMSWLQHDRCWGLY